MSPDPEDAMGHLQTPAQAPHTTPAIMTLRSSAFADGEPIPSRYTCEDRDVSPPLSWSGVPSGARSLALIVDDPDAPDPAAPQRTWVHWVLYNLPPTVTSLADGIGASFLQGARAGRNDFGRARYGGPCPPVGRHRYFFKLYALDTVLPELNKPTAATLQSAMAGHVVGQATLVGTYRKAR
jgi:Raf kinase inhibitor-like YbhB/YbcL family protein